MELSLKNIFFMISVGVILISVLLSILPSKTKKYTVLFRQPSESTPAKHILVHIPEKEIYISSRNSVSIIWKKY